MSKVVMHIRRGGKVEMKTKGVPGDGCLKASQPYREKLAGKVLSDEPTEEMNQVNPLTEGEFEQESQ
jgi:hypothetical protein